MNQTKDQSTPRPWRIESNVLYPNRLIYTEFGSVAVVHEVLHPHDKRSSGEIQEEAETNTRLIVKAVNCHDDLVEICDRLVCYLTLTGKTLTETESLLLNKAKKALSKAGE